jgi:origin recognition complex subunit 4
LTSFLLPTALPSFGTSSLQPTTTLSAPDSKLPLIPNLSTLSLALLISAARLDIIHDSDTCNFNMAYDEYVTLASKARIQSAAGGASASGAISKVWGKEVARREWEGLVELGLVMPVVGGVTGGFGMVRVDVALEEVGAVLGNEKGVDRSLERWCRHL